MSAEIVKIWKNKKLGLERGNAIRSDWICWIRARVGIVQHYLETNRILLGNVQINQVEDGLWSILSLNAKLWLFFDLTELYQALKEISMLADLSNSVSSFLSIAGVWKHLMETFSQWLHASFLNFLTKAWIQPIFPQVWRG